MATIFGNSLYFGDNLDVLRENIDDESVDLVYLDPPFNSNSSYNILFKEHSGKPADAQIHAFGDSWTWSIEAQKTYHSLTTSNQTPGNVADAIGAMRGLLGHSDMLAYLVMMTPRLLELRRVLKPTGSLYLHCDPTASHDLKIMLDAIFGPVVFRNEIIWKRYGAHSNSRGFGAIHDVILYYGKSRNVVLNKQYEPHSADYVAKRYRMADPDGRRFREQTLVNPAVRPNLQYDYTALDGVTYTCPANGWKYSHERMRELDSQDRLIYPTKPGGLLRLKNYLDEMAGMPVQDLWTDVGYIGSTSPERTPYPTQKPLALLERIIQASSNSGDVVLDPFCGCGTAVDAAQKLDRRWIGIDIAYPAIEIIQQRLVDQYGPHIAATYQTLGIPKDIGSATALFNRDAFEFERWVVLKLMHAQSNNKQIGDKGVDGTIRFTTGQDAEDKILISVKGGAHVGPAMVRDLVGTVQNHSAAMGVFVCLTNPTKGMNEGAASAGLYTYPGNNQPYPKVQIITIEALLSGRRPDLPPIIMPITNEGKMPAVKAKNPKTKKAVGLESQAS